MDVKLQDIAVKDVKPEPSGNKPEVNLVEQVNSTQPTETDDLLSRVTKFEQEASPANKSEEQIDKEIYNDAEFRQKIDAVQDPQLKEYLIQLRKSGVRGVNEKLSEIAEIRKELQAVKEGIIPKGWSPERVKQLINDPEFLQAAQQVAGVQPEIESDEYIPDAVKKELSELRNKVSSWEKGMTEMQKRQIQQNLERQHSELSNKYGNYDRNKVDEIRKELLEGKIQATNEHLYKAFYHDDNVRRAYEMGRRDASKGIQEKQEASSYEGTNQIRNSDISPEKEETNKQFWNRIINKRMEELHKK